MTEYGWLSILPPVLAIVTALVTRQVYLSLVSGIVLGWTILNGGNPLLGMRDGLESIVDVFKSSGNTRTLFFSFLIGSLITLTQRSGGVEGFIRWVTERGYVRSARGAQLLATLLGMGVFVESSLTCLVSGAISRPLFDRYRVSREKLAYICDSTSAPVCILIPLNGWGALILGILTTLNVEQPLRTLLGSIPYNFYALLAVALVFYVVLSGKDWGPMAKAEARARETGQLLREGASPMVSTEVFMETKEGVTPQARNMVVPMLAMILMMPVGLYITGEGDILAGSGSTSVLWAVLTAVGVGGVMYMLEGIFSFAEVMTLILKGIAGLVPVVLVLILAFAIGSTTSALGAGPYMAQLAQATLPMAVVPAILFWMSGIIAFSTGTSWGTFAIMLPIGVPMAELLGLSLPLMVGACLGGGIFGDHCSPISDTTIVSSMAAASDHIDHVNTQLPYALFIAIAASLLYIAAAIFS